MKGLSLNVASGESCWVVGWEGCKCLTITALNLLLNSFTTSHFAELTIFYFCHLKHASIIPLLLNPNGLIEKEARNKILRITIFNFHLFCAVEVNIKGWIGMFERVLQGHFESLTVEINSTFHLCS